MKRIIVIGLTLTNVAAIGQLKKENGYQLQIQPTLKNLTDSLSYALGLSVTSFYKQQGMANLNITLCSKGMNDALKSNKKLLNEQQANTVITTFLRKKKLSRKASSNKKSRHGIFLMPIKRNRALLLYQADCSI